MMEGNGFDFHGSKYKPIYNNSSWDTMLAIAFNLADVRGIPLSVLYLRARYYNPYINQEQPPIAEAVSFYSQILKPG